MKKIILLLTFCFCFLIAEDFKGAKMYKNDIEKLRKAYKPKNIKILFIGKSPPSRGTFFYNINHRSNMTIHTQKVFETVFKKKFSSEKEFLNFFKEQGCYLDDIFLTPTDSMTNSIKNNSIDIFSDRLKKYQPEIIIMTPLNIVPYAKKAIKSSGVKANCYEIPFAGQGHQNRYKEELEKILRRYLKE